MTQLKRHALPIIHQRQHVHSIHPLHVNISLLFFILGAF